MVGLPTEKNLVCSVEFNKTKGVTVRVFDAAGKKTQTVVIDHESMVLTVDGGQKKSTITQKEDSIISEVKGEETSTVTQKHDSVTVKCKTFTVDAETVEVKSSKDTTHDSKGKYTVTSTKDMSVTSSAKADFKATGNMTLEGQKFDAKGTSGATLKGLTVEVKGDTKCTVKSDTAVEVKGLKVDVKADGQLTLEGPITNVGQSMTTVKGQMVKVEGTLVKIG